MIVELTDLKAHLRVDYPDEDELIIALGEAAEQEVRNWIGRPIYASPAELPAEGDPDYRRLQMVADRTIVVAIKMIVDLNYRNREGSGGSDDDAAPPRSVRSLLAGHRCFTDMAPSHEVR